jgi:hypothetical protein
MFDGIKKPAPRVAWEQALAAYLEQAEETANRAIGLDDAATLRSVAAEVAGVAFLMEEELREWAQALQLKLAHAIKACSVTA